MNSGPDWNSLCVRGHTYQEVRCKSVLTVSEQSSLTQLRV
jgi:hypothetical protein